jgi:hypothetical protein
MIVIRYGLYTLLMSLSPLQLKSTLLSQETIPLTRAINLQITQTQSPYTHNEELTVDCPECFDTMVKIHESDKIRYHCENCDLIIPEMEVQEFID